MDQSIDMLDSLQPGSPFARGLNILLWIAMIILVAVFFFMMITGLSMFFPNGFQDMVFSELQDADNLPSPQKFGFIFLAAGAMTAGYIFVVNVLRKIVGTLIAGDPFVPDNISRLRRVWIALAVFELFRMISRSALAVEIDALSVTESTGATIDIRLGTWFLVFVIAALAEVFRHGAMLRRDQELTV